MNFFQSRLWLLPVLLALPLAAQAAGAEGESLLTPNQQKRIVQVNRDLPNDIKDQGGDSVKVAALRKALRAAYAGYRKAVKQYGTGTEEARQAAHVVVEAQQALHKQFVTEEAIPALSQVPQ